MNCNIIRGESDRTFYDFKCFSRFNAMNSNFTYIFVREKNFLFNMDRYQSQLTFFHTNFNRFLWKMDETK